MVIVASTSPKYNLWRKRIYLIGATSAMAITSIPVLLALALNQPPTGSFLSPLPEQQLAQAPSPTPQQETMNAQTAILTAQAYLEKAITLSQNPNQSKTDREQILAFLNQSLSLANQAVTLSPQAPEAYLVRARIFASASSIRPDATMLAQKDLEAAQALANGQSVDVPTQVNLLELEPMQQANGEAKVVIAAPEEANTKESTSAASSNTTKAIGSIPAGTTETLITYPRLNPNSYVYLISLDPSRVVYLKTKTEGEMTIATDSAPTQDLQFEYWVVNP